MNILAKRSFPEFYQSYAPKLLEFYSAWLDWTDLKGNSQYIINHLSTEHDIDESIDAYRTHLKDKYLNDFPEQMVIDLKLLLKNVLYLYRAKSSKKAYDFLFRVLFDSPAKLWYPRENILKTSDGRWYIPCYISINPITDSEGNAIYEQFNDEILTDAFGNTIDNAYLLDNCHYYRITGDISKSISYIEQATNFSGSVKTRDGNSKINENKDSSDNYDVILRDLAELNEGNYQYGQSAISITSSTGWFYPGETITITNVDTGEELPYHPVVQWYVETAGHYTSTKGFLSDINRIQDNHFYQNYSYVIQSYVGIRYWRDIVKKLLHPAGLGFFGEVLLSGDLEDGDGVYYYKDIDDRPKDTFDDNEDMQEYFKEHPEYKDSFNGKDQCEPYINYIRKFYVFFRHLLEYSNNILDYCFDSNGNHLYIEDSAEYKELHPYETYYNFELLYGENKIECIINSDKTIATINVVEYTEKKNKVKYSKKIAINKNNLFIINHLPYIFKTEEDGLKIVNGVNENKYEITDDKFTINNVEYEIIRYNNGNVKHIKCGDDIYEAYDSFHIDNIYETGYCAINSDYTNYKHKFSNVNRPITGTIKKYPSDETKNKARCCYKIYDKRDDNGNIEYDENGNKIKVCYQYYEPSVVYKPSYSYSINLVDYVYDENGNLLDENGNPMQYDENGNPIGKPKTKIGNGINFRRNTLAQTRSIITDIWLFNEYLAKQYPDVSERDLTPYVNKNSVLLFRDLGTLIDPDIIDWAYVGFKEDIDKPFMYNGELIDNYKTTDIYGVTLRPQYDVIIDTIDSNEYAFKEDDDFIPDNYLVFISSSHEANTSRVGTLTVKNEYLNYHNSTKVTDITENSFTLLGATFNINYDEDGIITSISNDLQQFNVYDNKFKVGNNDDTVEYFIDLKKNCVFKLTYYDAESYNAYMDKLVKDTILNDRAKRYLKDATAAHNTETDETDSDTRTIITRWGSLITNDFIYVSADSNRVFNEYSMVKIPDDYVTVDKENRKYVFNKNAYVDENIRIFNYANNDFSYKVWIERNNYDVTIKLTFFGNSIPRILPREYEYTSSYYWRNYWKKFIKNQNLEPVSYNVVEGTDKVTIEYKFNTPVDKQPAKFEIEFPEYIENKRMMLFTNGLLVPKVTTTGSKKTSITINTVENNNVKYQTDEIPFGDLTYVSDVFISENSTMVFGEMTLPDLLLLERDLTNLYDADLRDNATNIKSTTISTQTSYAELYVLSQIEAAGSPRMLKYPYNADLQTIYPEQYVALTDGTNEYSVATDNTFIIGNKTYSISSSIVTEKDDNGNITSLDITTYVTDGIDRYEVTGNQFTLGEGDDAVTYSYSVKSDILKRYMFTYDNLRMMPFAPHSFSVTKHADAEIAPDKESLKPSTYSHISWLELFNKEIKMTYHNVIGRTNDVQDHSELLDMVLDRFEYYRMMPKVNTNDVTLAQSIQEFIDVFSDDVHFRRGLNQMNTGTIREFVKNYDILCTTNYSSTLVFDENGIKITATDLMDDTISTDNHIDWARKEISRNWVNEENPVIQKLYSVPLNATKVAEGFYQKSNIIQSCPEYYKSKNTFIFVNGLKVLDSDIEYDDANYTYTINEKYFRDGRKKRIEVYNFGDNFLLSLGNKSGYISFEDTNHDWGVNMHPGLEVTVTVVED